MSVTRRQIEEEQAAELAPAPSGTESVSAPLTSFAALARATPAARRDAVMRSAGNASIARRLRPPPAAARTETRVERYAFNAMIRRAPSGVGQAAPEGAPAGRGDAPPGAEHGGEQFAGLFEALGAGAEAGAVPMPPPAAASPVAGAASAGAAAAPPVAPPEPAAAGPAEPAAAEPAGPEAPFTIPDIEVPALAELGKSDSIGATFTYSGSIARGGAAPSGFGVTRSFSSKLTGITITPSTGAFAVSATYEHPITYQVRTSTGPDGQVDIASETDGDITKTNYTTVVSDLTPNMSDLNGRPPRTKFWAEDLTLKHELVHADDDKGNGPAAMATVKTWLETQTATDAAGVRTHLGALPGRFASALLAALSTEDGEKHAYGDGAPSYTARADAVKAKGDKGDYP